MAKRVVDELITLLRYNINTAELQKHKKHLKEIQRTAKRMRDEVSKEVKFKVSDANVPEWKEKLKVIEKTLNEQKKVTAENKKYSASVKEWARKRRKEVAEIRKAAQAQKKVNSETREGARVSREAGRASRNAAATAVRWFRNLGQVIGTTKVKSKALWSSMTLGARRVRNAIRPINRQFMLMGRRINRTVSNILRFRNLVGVSLGGLAGYTAMKDTAVVGAEMEKRRLMLRNFGKVEGETNEEAEQRVASQEKAIMNTALKTPLDFGTTTDLYVNMLQRGMNPDKDLKGLVDSAFKYGGTQDDLKRALLQLGQGWAKNKFQGQDLRAATEARIPILEALANVVGDPTKDKQDNIGKVYEMASEGKLNREILSQAFDWLAKDAEGSAEEIANTMSGLTNKILDFKHIFQVMVNDSGYFDSLKEILKEITDKLFELYETGKLKEYAKAVSDYLVVNIKAFWEWLKKTAVAIRDGETFIQRLAKKVGGFGALVKWLGMVLLTAWLAPLLILVGQIMKLIWAMGAWAVQAIATTAATKGVAAAFALLGKSLLIGSIIATLIYALYKLWENWDTVVAWMTNAWETFTGTVSIMVKNMVQDIKDAFAEAKDIFETYLGGKVIKFAGESLGKGAGWVSKKFRQANKPEEMNKDAAVLRQIKNFVSSGEQNTYGHRLPVNGNNRPINNDNSSTVQNSVTVNGATTDPYTSANVIKQTLTDLANRQQRNSTTTVEY